MSIGESESDTMWRIVIQRKLHEERTYLVQGSDFHPIKEFDEDKLYKFIKRVVVK